MKPNMSKIDRSVRILFALVVAILYFTNTISGAIGLGLLIAGGILLATAFINFCPIYKIFGISTKKEND